MNPVSSGIASGIEGAYHDRHVCRRYEPLSVVETFGHPRNDRWLLGSIPGHGPDLHERSTDPRAGRGRNGRQVIVWVRKTDSAGAVTTYRTPDFKGDPDPEKVRLMDCIDCHNRPSHRYESPNDAVDEAMYLGRIDPALPQVKRTVVDLLTKTYATQDAATASMSAALRARYGDAPRVLQAVAAVEAIYRSNFFPEMKADWSKYPDN